MEYKKIRPKKLYEQIADIIEQQIAKKEIVPGEKLDSVEQLAKRFEVGRSAIREALTSLQAKGILEIRHGEGTFVNNSPKDIQIVIPSTLIFEKEHIKNIFEIRKILEVGLIENAAKYRTEEQLGILKDTLDRMEKSVFHAELSGEADSLFHHTIAEAANNPLLVTMLHNVSSTIEQQIIQTRELLSYTNKDALLQLHQEHIDIFRAIETREAGKAKEAMQRHLIHVEGLLFYHLENK